MMNETPYELTAHRGILSPCDASDGTMRAGPCMHVHNDNF